MKEILRYELNKDGKGLLAYNSKKKFYHIHSTELSPLEKWIKLLLKQVKYKV